MPLKIQRDDQTSINLTPMIDIVFLLIIFFMVSTRFGKLQNERDISLQVPTVTNASALTSAPRKRVINVYKDGQISLDQKMVSLEQLEYELSTAREQYSKLGVVIRGDAETYHQRVAEVMATCNKASISDLNISVREVQFR